MEDSQDDDHDVEDCDIPECQVCLDIARNIANNHKGIFEFENRKLHLEIDETSRFSSWGVKG